MPHRTLFIATALALPLVACDKQSEPDTPQNAAYGAGHPPGTGAGAPTAGDSGPDGSGNTPPTSEQTATGQAATPLPPGSTVLASPVLKAGTQAATAGRTADGPAFGATFQRGQIHEQTFQLQPGRCYTVVGLGIGITELDVEIVLHQPPAPEYVAAQDDDSGPQAVLGEGRNCFENPLPTTAQAKVRLTASGGNGVAVAQIYSG